MLQKSENRQVTPNDCCVTINHTSDCLLNCDIILVTYILIVTESIGKLYYTLVHATDIKVQQLIKSCLHIVEHAFHLNWNIKSN